jgi:type I restriction enzyme M protein
LNDSGRAGLVMANSASDARHSEADIRQTLIEQNLISVMLTLPSNMFYTVTLPATLWFFDKAKTDARILFIDARNIFSQIDRAHREFSEEQVQNIAIISRLHKGRSSEFLALIDGYFKVGMERLEINSALVKPVSAQLLEVLDDGPGKTAVAGLVAAWQGLVDLRRAYSDYQQASQTLDTVEETNQAQQQLRAAFTPFFAALHTCLKQIDKVVLQHEKESAAQAALAKAGGKAGKRQNIDRATKQLKSGLEALHAEVKQAESSFGHISWLQERFPEARYEDVTGLCKLADLAEVREQDYSLNPGRYVGVVIEEDGKTEEEFVETVLDFNEQLKLLNDSAKPLEAVICQNVRTITGSE